MFWEKNLAIGSAWIVDNFVFSIPVDEVHELLCHVGRLTCVVIYANLDSLYFFMSHAVSYQYYILSYSYEC